MGEPPDKYKTYKIPLSKIIKKNDPLTYDKIQDACIRTHHAIIHVCQFLRLWVISKYHQNIDIPEITEDLIQVIFKALSKPSRGPKTKGENNKLLNEFNSFYDDVYSKLGLDEKLNMVNLSHIIDSSTTSILTNIENNIKLHFTKYINRFVNSFFKNSIEEQILNLTSKEKVIRKKELWKEIAHLKKDLLNNTLTCDPKYYNWLNEYRYRILPKDFIDSYQFDIKENPQKYLKHMIFMNLELERLGKKQFQFLPLRTDLTTKYIPIDTATIIDLLFITDKLVKDKDGNIMGKDYYNHHVMDERDFLWNNSFRFDHQIFWNKKNYVFDYSITTDGYAASVRFINEKYVDEQNKKKGNLKESRKNARTNYKGMTQEEKDEHKAKKKEDAKNVRKEKRLALKAKKLTDQQVTNKTKEEFPYFDDLNEKELKEMSKNYIVIDPGKRTLLTMMNSNKKMSTYTNRQRLHETKRLKFQRLRENFKIKSGIKNVEEGLLGTCAKSCNQETFKEYIIEKNETVRLLLIQYHESKFRKYKWYAHINTKRSEDRLLNRIEKEYGKKSGNENNINIIIGDWDMRGNHMKHFISTPMVGLKRKLKERFKVYNLDEYKTSCIHHKTEERTGNLYLKHKDNEIRKMHSILTYQMENKNMGCINRDRNSVLNMLKIVQHWITFRKRPEALSRTKKIKETNPLETVSQMVLTC